MFYEYFAVRESVKDSSFCFNNSHKSTLLIWQALYYAELCKSRQYGEVSGISGFWKFSINRKCTHEKGVMLWLAYVIFAKTKDHRSWLKLINLYISYNPKKWRNWPWRPSGNTEAFICLCPSQARQNAEYPFGHFTCSLASGWERTWTWNAIPGISREPSRKHRYK